MLEMITLPFSWLLYLIVCILIVAPLVKLYPLFIIYYRQCYHLKQLQFLPYHWLLGNLPFADGSQKAIVNNLDIIVKRKLKLVVVWFGPFFATVACYRPDTIKAVLKEPKGHLVHRLFVPWIGTGLLIANGDKWFRNRKLLTPAFHYGVLKPYVQVYNECAYTLIGCIDTKFYQYFKYQVQLLKEKWMKMTSQNSSIEICEPVTFATLDVILQCAFSYRSNCQDTREKSSYVSAIISLSKIATQRILYLPHQIDLLFYLSPSGREFKRLCSLVHNHSEKVIRDRRNVLEEQIKMGELLKPAAGRKYLDFLDILLTSKDDNGVGLSDEEIRAEVDTFMFEGHDTTAAGISWTLYCLAKHPIHQQKCREEIQLVLDGRKEFEWEDMKSLQYTTMCIREAMRLYPPVPYFFKELSEDINVQGCLIPKGTMVIVSLIELHRQPDLWENPEVYDPLRFLPERSDKRDSFVYMPFSAGPRTCIGQVFALNEERVFIGSILNKFSLELDEDHTVEWIPTVTLRAKYGIKLNLNPL